MTKFLVILAFIAAVAYTGISALGQFEAATAKRIAAIDALTGAK